MFVVTFAVRSLVETYISMQKKRINIHDFLFNVLETN